MKEDAVLDPNLSPEEKAGVERAHAVMGLPEDRAIPPVQPRPPKPDLLAEGWKGFPTIEEESALAEDIASS